MATYYSVNARVKLRGNSPDRFVYSMVHVSLLEFDEVEDVVSLLITRRLVRSGGGEVIDFSIGRLEIRDSV